MIYEHWEKTEVIGRGENREAREVVLHRRGADVVGMAIRRNPKMQGCDTFTLRTVSAFKLERKRDDGRRKRKDIPRDENYQKDWDPWEL